MKSSVSAALLLSAGLLISACERAPKGDDSKPVVAKPEQNSSPLSNAPQSTTEMVQVPAGRFQMGDKAEVDAKPHEVAVGGFLMDKTLVTQDQYEKAMGDNPSRWKGGKNP